MGWATFWSIFSQTLVTLVATTIFIGSTQYSYIKSIHAVPLNVADLI
jgi:hypothetical protein